MSMVITKQQVSIEVPGLITKQISRLQQLLSAWSKSQECIYTRWSQFHSTSSGRKVTYRVWSRYGAYLEAQQEIYKH